MAPYIFLTAPAPYKTARLRPTNTGNKFNFYYRLLQQKKNITRYGGNTENKVQYQLKRFSKQSYNYKKEAKRLIGNLEEQLLCRETKKKKSILLYQYC